MSERKLFTSESVSEGHPDKIADVNNLRSDIKMSPLKKYSL